jgi:hypothetical protein
MPQKGISMRSAKLEGIKNSQEAYNEADEIDQDPDVFHASLSTIE